jgi:hypothetical protein
VAFAGKPKNIDTLHHVARLCRWLETNHNIPQVWPNGLPRKGVSDPGGHNRNATEWGTKGGHYGHCHMPENSHWDPGYTKNEVDIIMAAPVRQAPSLVEWKLMRCCRRIHNSETLRLGPIRSPAH